MPGAQGRWYPLSHVQRSACVGHVRGASVGGASPISRGNAAEWVARSSSVIGRPLEIRDLRVAGPALKRIGQAQLAVGDERDQRFGGEHLVDGIQPQQALAVRLLLAAGRGLAEPAHDLIVTANDHQHHPRRAGTSRNMTRPARSVACASTGSAARDGVVAATTRPTARARAAMRLIFAIVVNPMFGSRIMSRAPDLGKCLGQRKLIVERTFSEML